MTVTPVPLASDTPPPGPPQGRTLQQQKASSRNQNQQSGATHLNNARKPKKHSHQCSATDVGDVKIIRRISSAASTAFIAITKGKETSW